MKRLLSLLVSLSLLSPQAQCASTQALRYLKLAGTAAWQGAKMGAQWTAKNPKKTVGTIGLSALAWDSYKTVTNFKKQTNDYTQKMLARIQAAEKVNVNDPLALFCKDFFAKYGGIKVAVEFKETNHFIMVTPEGGKVLLTIDRQQIQPWMQPIHYEAILCHELLHVLEHHGDIQQIFGLLNAHDDYRKSAVSYFMNFLDAYFNIRSKINEVDLSKYLERRADSHVATIAFKERRPELLDALEECFKADLLQGQYGGFKYPLTKDRLESAHAAAAELRELMTAEKRGLFFLRSDGEMTPMQKIYCPSSNF